MTRREWLALIAATPLLKADSAPTAPVSIAKCASYEEDVTAKLATMSINWAVCRNWSETRPSRSNST